MPQRPVDASKVSHCCCLCDALQANSDAIITITVTSALGQFDQSRFGDDASLTVRVALVAAEIARQVGLRQDKAGAKKKKSAKANIIDVSAAAAAHPAQETTSTSSTTASAPPSVLQAEDQDVAAAVSTLVRNTGLLHGLHGLNILKFDSSDGWSVTAALQPLTSSSCGSAPHRACGSVIFQCHDPTGAPLANLSFAVEAEVLASCFEFECRRMTGPAAQNGSAGAATSVMTNLLASLLQMIPDGSDGWVPTLYDAKNGFHQKPEASEKKELALWFGHANRALAQFYWARTHEPLNAQPVAPLCFSTRVAPKPIPWLQQEPSENVASIQNKIAGVAEALTAFPLQAHSGEMAAVALSLEFDTLVFGRSGASKTSLAHAMLLGHSGQLSNPAVLTPLPRNLVFGRGQPGFHHNFTAEAMGATVKQARDHGLEPDVLFQQAFTRSASLADLLAWLRFHHNTTISTLPHHIEWRKGVAAHELVACLFGRMFPQRRSIAFNAKDSMYLDVHYLDGRIAEQGPASSSATAALAAAVAAPGNGSAAPSQQATHGLLSTGEAQVLYFIILLTMWTVLQQQQWHAAAEQQRPGVLLTAADWQLVGRASLAAPFCCRRVHVLLDAPNLAVDATVKRLFWQQVLGTFRPNFTFIVLTRDAQLPELGAFQGFKHLLLLHSELNMDTVPNARMAHGTAQRQ